jgi:hypothetical protein
MRRLNFAQRRTRHLKQKAKIRDKFRREAEVRRKKEEERRRLLAGEKAKKARIKLLKQRFLATRATITLLEAEIRRFYRLTGVAKEVREMRESGFVKPKKPRRQWEVATEARIKSISNPEKKRAMAKQKWGQLIREIDRLSLKEGKIRDELRSLWGEKMWRINLTEFIKGQVEPDVWAELGELPPSAMRVGKASH